MGGFARTAGLSKFPPAFKVETIPFTENLSATAVTIPWGDVATAFYSTGIPNIEVFLGVPEKQLGRMKVPGVVRSLLALAPVQAFVKALIARRVKGPTDEQRARDEVYVYGEVWDDAGHKVAMRLRTREAYTLTAESSVTAILKVLESRLAPGAYTPSKAFGAEYSPGPRGRDPEPRRRTGLNPRHQRKHVAGGNDQEQRLDPDDERDRLEQAADQGADKVGPERFVLVLGSRERADEDHAAEQHRQVVRLPTTTAFFAVRQEREPGQVDEVQPHAHPISAT